MQSVCPGCRERIWQDDARGTFTGGIRGILATEKDVEGITEPENPRLELTRGIELITGRKIDKTNERSVGFCDSCSQKVVSYLNFRARLLSSLSALNVFAELHGSDPEESETLRCPDGKTGHTDERSRKGIDNDEPVNRKTPISRSLSEDIINVDENSTPLNLDANTSFNDEPNSDDSLNDSPSSNDLSSKEVLSKIEENDIESEIDVCSGEDDEVLELDSRSRRDETVEIGSSSNESDIEVCDYEPTGKRVKSYATLSPPRLY